MQRYITFLGGISVGTTPREMENLRGLFTRLGFSNIETYLQSGNVVFSCAPVGVIAPLEAQITRFLKKSLGEDVEAFVRTPDELEEIVDNDPFQGDDTAGSLFVVLTHEPVSDRVQRSLRYARTSADEFRANGREIYWLRRKSDRSGAPATPSIAEVLGMPATVRSFNTFKKLASQYSGRSTGFARSRR